MTSTSLLSSFVKYSSMQPIAESNRHGYQLTTSAATYEDKWTEHQPTSVVLFSFSHFLIKEKFRKSTGASASGKLQYSFVSLDLISLYSLSSNAELSFVLVLIHTLSLLCVQDNRTFPVRMFGD